MMIMSSGQQGSLFEDMKTTPTIEELKQFMDSLTKGDQETVNNFVYGSRVAILSLGEPSQPYADVVSLGVYGITGIPTYRGTLNLEKLDTEKRKELRDVLNDRKLIVVEGGYNQSNAKRVEEEFARDSYRLAGLMYFSALPTPKTIEVKLQKESRPQKRKAGT
jgi:hypothetical protein